MVRREGGTPATEHHPPDFLNPREGDFAEEESDDEDPPAGPLTVSVPPPKTHDDGALAAVQPSAAVAWLRSAAQDPASVDHAQADGGLVLSLRASQCIDPDGTALGVKVRDWLRVACACSTVCCFAPRLCIQRSRSDKKSSKSRSRTSRRPPSDDEDDLAALLDSDSEEETLVKSRRSSLARQASVKGRRRRGLFVRDAGGFLVVKQTLDTTLQQLHRMAQDPSAWYPEEATDAPHPLRVMLLRYREAVGVVGIVGRARGARD